MSAEPAPRYRIVELDEPEICVAQGALRRACGDRAVCLVIRTVKGGIEYHLPYCVRHMENFRTKHPEVT